jgi:hypothetical protein
MGWHNKRNLAAQIFGRLTVLGEAGRVNKTMTWLCQCSCGNQTVKTAGNLCSGRSTSCGCFARETSANTGRAVLTIHGHTHHGEAKPPTYRSWQSMIQRCTNPKATSYPQYGGRGVTVCERWKVFENFLADMGERPPGTTLSRFGDVGNYAPGNCAWHTPNQQRDEARKKRMAAAAA